VTEAVLLVGGQGTRLRPLTMETPKPMLPVAGVPVTEHQIARAREAGVTRIVLGTSYRAEVFEEYFGDGSRFGVELVYVTEDEPLGTGGAIRNVADYLHSGPDDPVLIFNGDVLSGVDLRGLVNRHTSDDCAVTLYLTRVEDPRAYGLVPTNAQGWVTGFLEKPTSPEEIVTDQINAGAYVFRRSVIDHIPAGRVVSVEREVFPTLIAEGARVAGYVDDGYWLDLGTPMDFVRGSCDLVLGVAPSPAVPGPIGESLVLAGARVEKGAVISHGSVIGAGAVVESGAVVDGSVVMANAFIAAGAQVCGSVIAEGAHVSGGASLRGAVVGARAVVGAFNELREGARVWSDVKLADLSVRFSSDR